MIDEEQLMLLPSNADTRYDDTDDNGMGQQEGQVMYEETTAALSDEIVREATVSLSIDNDNSSTVLPKANTIVPTANHININININIIMGNDIFDSVICSHFLESDDMIALLQVEDTCSSESTCRPQLRQRYCTIHGTKLDFTYEDGIERRRYHQKEQAQTQDRNRNRDNKNNNSNSNSNGNNTDNDNDDLQFFSWCLEQQAFISATKNNSNTNNDSEEGAGEDEGEEATLPSLLPDCLDCRMTRFHQKKKCAWCDEFEHRDDMFTCAGKKCGGAKTACVDCHEGSWSCNQKNCKEEEKDEINNGTALYYCGDCFFDIGYYCQSCMTEYHTNCMSSLACQECGEHVCKECRDAGEDDCFICTVCDTFFCHDCRESGWCTKCSTIACATCRETLYCASCDGIVCADCEDHVDRRCCSVCEEETCTNCAMGYLCEGEYQTFYWYVTMCCVAL